MAVAEQLIILLSVGSFQALLPLQPNLQPSPVFEDNAKGARELTTWAKGGMPVPKFAQPPLRICVVGAVAFKPEQVPFLPQSLWESKFPLRALEPYSATFHYVEEPKPGKDGKPAKPLKPQKPRTLKEAQKICAEAAKLPPPAKPFPHAPTPSASQPKS